MVACVLACIFNFMGNYTPLLHLPVYTVQGAGGGEHTAPRVQQHFGKWEAAVVFCTNCNTVGSPQLPTGSITSQSVLLASDLLRTLLG